MAEDLREFEISAFFEEDGERQVMPGEVMIIKGQLRSGFMYPMIKFVAIYIFLNPEQESQTCHCMDLRFLIPLPQNHPR